MISGLECTHAVRKNIDIVIEIVTGFKRAKSMHKLVNEYRHKKERETRFGTTCDVMERSVKSASQVHDILIAREGLRTHAATQLIAKFSLLRQTKSTNGSKTFTASQAVIEVFLSLREMKIAKKALLQLYCTLYSLGFNMQTIV